MNDTPEQIAPEQIAPEQIEDVALDDVPADQPVEQHAGDVSPDGAQAPADLGRIERDLAGVETALQRLDAGTYWTDEATGQPIPDEVLAADPVARRAP